MEPSSPNALPSDTLTPIAFYARKISSAERNYPLYDKKLLAIHEALQDWRHFLQGGTHSVTVWSDHQSLSYFMTTKQLTLRHARWSFFFSSFDFIIKARPGSENAQADALSRRPDFKPPGPDNSFSLLSPDHFVPTNASTELKLPSPPLLPFHSLPYMPALAILEVKP